MDYFKKKKIKAFFKNNKGKLISTGVFLSAGLIAIIIGMYMSGWSFLKWIKTGYGLTTLICVVLGLFIITMLWLFWKNIKSVD